MLETPKALTSKLRNNVKDENNGQSAGIAKLKPSETTKEQLK